jgi:hypothetical protein
MRYADECCTYTEINSPEHAYVFTGKCRMTGETVSVTVPGKELYADREFLMTGLSGEAWDKTFGEED